VGPQFSKLFRDDMFDCLLQGDEKKAWDTFRLISANFLGIFKAENYKELIEGMLLLYHNLGCDMSLKIHMLHSHLDFLPTTRACLVMSTVNFPSGNWDDGESISRKVFQLHVGWLLFDARQKCSWAATQTTDKAKLQAEVDFYRHMFDVLYLFLECIINFCGFLRNRCQFWVFVFIFVFSASKWITNGYCYLRSIRAVKICCPV